MFSSRFNITSLPKWGLLYLSLFSLACQDSVSIKSARDGGAESDLVKRDLGSSDTELRIADTTSDVLDLGRDASTHDLSQDTTNDVFRPDFGDTPFGGSRPAKIILPKNYDPKKSYPLLTLLHGYSSGGTVQNAYLGFGRQVDKREFIYIIAEGLRDGRGQKYWNATDGCCDFDGTNPDDAGYLIGLVDEAIQRYNIDETRIYFTGHSNGGFMSYTLACKYGDRIAAIASLAGTTFLDPALCEDTGDVSILHVHGTLDAVIRFRGARSNGTLNGYPGAEETVNRWVTRNGCESSEKGSRKNLSSGIIGKETRVKRWEKCDNGTQVEFWEIRGASHVPVLTKEYANGVLDFLLSQKK